MPVTPTLKQTSLVVAVLTVAACTSTTLPTPVASCPAQLDGTRPTRGALEVLPSDVPELALDSMRWSLHMESEAPFFTQTVLYMGGRITSTREVPLWGIGVLFEGQRDSQIVFRQLVRDFIASRPVPGFEHNAATLIPLHRVLPDRPVPVSLGATNVGRDVPRGWGCPTRARLVREMELAKHLGLVERFARDSARLLAERRAERGVLAPIEILIDTLLATNYARSAVVGVAVNTTDRTIRNAAVWIAVNRSPTDGGPDTLSFPLGDVAPHALVSFGGGAVMKVDARPGRGVWLDDDDGPRVTAMYQNTVSIYRRANNGQIPRSLIANDERQTSYLYPWNPARFDLDSVLATRRIVFALLHGATAESERAEVAIVLGKVLYRRRAHGVVYADSSRALMAEMDSVLAGARAIQSVPMIPPPGMRPLSDEEVAQRGLQPGAGEDVLVSQGNGGWMRRVKFPAGHPPAALQRLFDALTQIERRSASRAGVSSQ
jgi:hypothetical protein